MKLISFLLKHSPRLLALAVITGIASGVASAVLVAIVNTALGQLGRPASPIGWAFIGFTITVLVSNLCSRLLLLRLSTTAVMKMRLHLCRQLLLSPLRQVESLGSSRLMAALTEDILAVSDTLADFPLLCINGAVILASLTYLLWLNWRLGLGVMAFFAVGLVSYELIEVRTRPYLKQGREKWDELIGFYQALILGNKELKLHQSRRKAFFAEGVAPTAAAMQKLSFGWHSIYAVASGYGQIFYFLVIGAVLFVAPALGKFDVGVLTGFTLLTIYLNGPISFIVGVFPAFQRAAVSLGKIESLGFSLAAAGRSDLEEKELSPAASFSGLKVIGLEYTYQSDAEDRTFTLGPIDLTLRPGELTFITGGNGSGKSSFARVLTGLYVPDSGTILFNGAAVTDENRDQYRQNFSTVFSDYFLFDRLFGLISESLADRVAEYLKRLRLETKVKVVDGNFSTTSLSQGQRKRLALLTAFIEDRHIYLFDEWAADQDPEFKDVFYHEILPDLKAKGKTVLVISHDDHYYHAADRLIKFENGLIVEDRANALGHEREATPYAARATGKRGVA